MKTFKKYPSNYIKADSSNVPYPSLEEIDALEADPSNQSVEDAYYDQCINAINDGCDGNYESDRAGITIFRSYEDEDYDIFIDNDTIKEVEIECLRDCSNWEEFHTRLADYFAECC